MANRQFLESVLNVLNFFLMLSGLTMVGFGIYRLIIWNRTSNGDHSNQAKLVLVDRLLLAVDQSNETKKLPLAWFLFLFIAVGATLFIISCFGSIGAGSRNRCCLSSYSVFMAILLLLEVGLGAFIFLDRKWKERIPTDKTGNWSSIYAFMDSKWNIMKWVALGAFILEVMALLLAVYLHTMAKPLHNRLPETR